MAVDGYEEPEGEGDEGQEKGRGGGGPKVVSALPFFEVDSS